MADKAEVTQAKTGNGAMIDAYNKGVSIDDIAQEHNLTAEEVTAIVVTPVPAPAPLQTQAELDEQESKKGK